MRPDNAWFCMARDTEVNNAICQHCFPRMGDSFKLFNEITARTRAECAAQNKVDSREKDVKINKNKTLTISSE